MMEMMAECCGGWGAGMMWGMGLFALLILVLSVLAAAALVKYLLSGRRPRRDRRPEAPGPGRPEERRGR
jgi:hypothetical protein